MSRVRTAWFRVHVVTRYRARTEVERWQIQDRLRGLLRGAGFQADAARFYESTDGRIAFSLPRAALRRGPGVEPLQRIDGPDGER